MKLSIIVHRAPYMKLKSYPVLELLPIISRLRDLDHLAFACKRSQNVQINN